MYYLKRPLKAKVSTVFIPNEYQKLQVALKHRNSASPGRTKLHHHSIKTSPTNTNMFYHEQPIKKLKQLISKMEED